VWLVKVSPYNLTVTTVLWDVVYNGAWFAVMIFALGDVKGPLQAVGALLVLAGLVLMGV
jgi:hypothetical protein